ncbi:hypothetical protein Tsubulata_020570 [Turnera subulata]|uniref:BRCT domain-containing protein n=1 Tax=Turnera subulata TaxID=218843 RepID=A0A9Q0JKC2_9ROSI|nr:hypothetical protein Tsubulata_020570 [Turnera subulata]
MGGGGGGGGGVQVIDSRGCSRLFMGLPSSMPSFRGLHSFEPASPTATSSAGSESLARSHGPFAGLVICVTGLSKVRLSESLYTVKNVGDNGVRVDELNRFVGVTGSENSCLSVGINDARQSSINSEGTEKQSSRRNSSRSTGSTLSGNSMYVDSDISGELRSKVYEAAIREGSTLFDQWFVGSGVSHVVCEGTSVQKYLGHSNNLVTPLWVLKTAKEKHVQKLVHMSTDLARQVGLMLENVHNGVVAEEVDFRKTSQNAQNSRKVSHEERLQIAHSAKAGVRDRRSRRMQTCQSPIRPITPSVLLDSICWSISESASSASIYTDSCSSEDLSEHHASVFFDAKGEIKDQEASFANLTRPLTESEKVELIFKNHFLTILFPTDRFSEMGPSSRTFFSGNGFTCMQVLDHIYAFYQENMSDTEIEAAIHTDSRHADRLRSVFSSKETAEVGHVIFKRIDFLGSRRSFEMLKRVSGDNNSNVYELLTRA